VLSPFKDIEKVQEAKSSDEEETYDFEDVYSHVWLISGHGAYTTAVPSLACPEDEEWGSCRVGVENDTSLLLWIYTVPSLCIMHSSKNHSMVLPVWILSYLEIYRTQETL
jgi:hypothetical protein